MPLDWRTGYLEQAKSDYAILELLRAASNVPLCQRLHYLQMATEKMAKGFLTPPGAGPYPKTHDAFVRFVRAARSRQYIRDACGFTRSEAFSAYLDSLLPLAREIENLSPEGEEHPNPEYPWEVNGAIYSPLRHPFAALDFRNVGMTRMMQFIENCLSIA